MFAKMPVFLLIMLSIQQAKSCASKRQPILIKTALTDCTKTFTNRIASFEPLLLPGNWMFPKSSGAGFAAIYSTSTASVKADKTYHWFLHGCGSGKVCLEAKRNGWEDYYIYYGGVLFVNVVKDTNLYGGSNKAKEMEIWCTSCDPERDDLTYSDCELYTDYGGEREAVHVEVYTVIKSKQGHVKKGCNGRLRPYDHYKWRILSPPTRQYWETTTAGYNCDGLHGVPVSHTVTSSITRTSGTTQTTEVNAKISLGKKAAEALKLLGGETGIKHSWSTTSTTEAAEGRSTTLGGIAGRDVRPGYKWIVKQLVGEAGYTKIKPLVFTSEDVKCT